MRAVIDRFEGSYAVLLLGNDEAKVDWPRQYLPEDAEEGSILGISFEVKHEETKATREKMQQRLDRLKKRCR